ncbi:sensor histidine kinase [Archangium primigenium]|uniref:sensor histidine kinase n=1 Tax=[Archangium] primigenium TaxID=2792470 RepID=UPI00195BD50F|nr:ATP-binding protein [Archangium primigenium]MBM7112540.1 RsbRD N-terminal domain-containing protein [Archangium primigenium]
MTSAIPPPRPPLRLADFLRRERDGLLAEWERADRALPRASRTSQTDLRDHIPDLLEEIAERAERVRGGQHDRGGPRRTPRAHAHHRLELGFRLGEVAREYALLRKVILTRLGPRVGELAPGELVLLNESLDQAVSESVDAWSEGARARVERERARLERVLESLPTAILIAEAPSGRVVYGNPRVEDLLGHPALATDDIAGFGAYFGHDLERRRYAAEAYPLARALRGEHVQGEEMYYLRPDGVWRYLQVSAVPVYDGEGQLTSAVLCMADLTRVKELEDLARQRADFERQLIGIVSHDLRSPLSAIALGATVLLRREDLDARQRSAITRIITSSERAHRMIRDLLDFTQARLGGGIPLERRPMDAHALARQVVDEVGLAHPEHPIDVEAHGDGHGEWDADRLAQVLINLLNNALRHGAPDTPVTVRTVGEAEGLRLEVHNRGAPIPEALRARLFQPMERGTQAQEGREGRSIGLGLYIVDHVIQAHGGRIEVRSSEAEGTTFTVVLPRRAPPRGA